MQKDADFMHLKRLMDTFDWLSIGGILGKAPFSRRGKKKEFFPINLFRVFLLKSYLLLDDNTLIVRRLSENKDYLRFCGLKRVPSRDVLNNFEDDYSRKFICVFEFIDDILEKNHAFEDDDRSFDGTDIPVPFKHEQSPHRYHFGAKSDKKKFHGFWLMIVASVKHQIPRRFIVGYGREGQINLGKELLSEKQIDGSINNIFLIMDGIFDFREMHEIVISIQHKIPLIGYNKRGSGIEDRIDLPSTDWHFQLNPVYRNNDFVLQEFKKRTSIERVNSHSKIYSAICLIQNKVRKSHTIKKRQWKILLCFHLCWNNLNYWHALMSNKCRKIWAVINELIYRLLL